MSPPELIGLYSIDKDNNLRSDASQLKYFTAEVPEDGRVNLDLIRNSHLVELADYTKRRGIFFDYLREHKQLLQEIGYLGIVTNSFTIRQISRLPELGNDFEVSLYQGKIYLTVKQRGSSSNKNNKDCKFEQSLTSDSPVKKPNTNEIFRDAERFYCVYRWECFGHPIIYAEATHGNFISLHEAINANGNIIEFSQYRNESDVVNILKDKKFIKIQTWSEKRYDLYRKCNFRLCAQTYYIMGYLEKCNQFYFGIKNKNEHVTYIKKYETNSFPTSKYQWKMEVANFFRTVKCIVRSEIKDNYVDPSVPYAFVLRYDIQSGLLSKLENCNTRLPESYYT